jgi:hypothetical protein
MIRSLRGGQYGLLAVVLALLPVGSQAGARVLTETTVTATATATASPTPTPTAAPTSTATPTPRPAPTATSRPTSIPTKERTTPHRGGKRSRRRHPTSHPALAPPTATATPTVTPQHETAGRKHRGRLRKRHKDEATPAPTPTSTPDLAVNAEDSVLPVTCNGQATAPAAQPFLVPPFHGWNSIASFFDHDSPNFVQDGLVILANGVEAAPDRAHHRTDFPAYWNRGLRQYVYYDGHNGFDYNLWYQPVYAAAAGKVIFAAYEYPSMPDHGYGQMIMIDHHHGYVTLYGHLSQFLVKPGQKVRAGQKIAISGNTGHSTGPHLHFSVFHNCTPTDPYGWTGSGQDPLMAFQGEASENLWKAVPLVDNPPPAWPGPVAAVPPTERIVLLRLPSTSAGTSAFTSALRTEAESTARPLRKRGATVKIDLLRGALLVEGSVNSQTIYRLPGVASIATPSTIAGAKSDLLAALAHASLATRHERLILDPSRHWTGYLLHWDGRTFLVGTGSRGQRTVLTLPGGRGGTSIRHLEADPKTGAYAVDLGRLDRGQVRRVIRDLSVKQKPHAAATPVAERGRAPAHAPGPRAAHDSAMPTVTAGVLVVLSLAGVALWVRRRRLPLVGD